MYPLYQQEQQQQQLQHRQLSNFLMNLIDFGNNNRMMDKKSLMVNVDTSNNNDSTGSILNLNDLTESSTAFIGTICMASGFILLVIFASIYYYRKRNLYHDYSTGSINHLSTNKILLLKKDLKFNNEKPYQIRTTTAPGTVSPAPVRSPNSSHNTSPLSATAASKINPFQKKSPSPTGGLSPNDEHKNRNVDVESGRNNSTISCISHSVENSKNNSPITEEPVQKQQTIEKLSPTDTNQQQQQQQQPQNLGKLYFKLKYSYEKRSLCLTINRCTDLSSPTNSSTTTNNTQLDPYVKIQLLPEKQHKAKTRVLRKTSNPIYNEEFTFYGITSQMLQQISLHFIILNFDRFSKDEVLGEVVCRLNQYEYDSLEKQLVLCNDIIPIGNKLKIQDLGELLVSLCYQPIANRLTVVILKARNLPKMDLTGLCDPYVKIYVYHNNERISKKRTHIKRRTLSPVFNESFVFDIPNNECLDNIRLEFLIYDHDRVTRNELIGKIDIGSKTGVQTTEKHWHEVIKSPRRQIAEWHKLKEITN